MKSDEAAYEAWRSTAEEDYYPAWADLAEKERARWDDVATAARAGTYTRAQVEDFINTGANLVQGEIGGESGGDFVSVLATAQLFQMDEPGLTFDQILNRNWADSEYDHEKYKTPAEWVRNWWDW